MSVLITQAADPIVVDVVSDGTPWWEIVAALGPFAILIAAGLTFWIAAATLRQRATADSLALAQKRAADDRSEWWRRTQWALDAATSQNPIKQTTGLKALRVLARSELATKEELEMLDAAWSDDPAVGPDRRKWRAGRLVDLGRQWRPGNSTEDEQ